MMETQELVVPRSIPMTGPDTFPLEDHRCWKWEFEARGIFRESVLDWNERGWMARESRAAEFMMSGRVFGLI
jgi:hypothetical protein